jgi:hypothetical protein
MPFDLFRIDDFARQVVVDLNVRQVALLFATGNQQLQLRLTLIGELRRFLLCCQSFAQVVALCWSGVGGLKKTAQCTLIVFRALGSLSRTMVDRKLAGQQAQ